MEVLRLKQADKHQKRICDFANALKWIVGLNVVFAVSALVSMALLHTDWGSERLSDEMVILVMALWGLMTISYAVLYALDRKRRQVLNRIDEYLSELPDRLADPEHRGKWPVFPVGVAMPHAARGWNQWIGYLDRIQQQHQLREAQNQAGKFLCSYDAQKLLGLFDSLTDGIILADAMGSIVLANRASEGKLYRPLSEYVHRPVIDLFTDGSARNALQEMLNPKSLRAHLEFEVTIEIRSQCHNNNGISCEHDECDSTTLWVICRRLDENNDSSDLLLILRDITQQKISQANQEDFISHVSHELRSPLTNIRAYSETLLSDMLLDAEKQKEAFNVINEETSRLIRLVNEVLDFSKMETGSFALNRSEINMERLVQQCVNDIKGAASAKNITLQTNYHPKLPTMYADREKLAVVFHNILSNAVKYTPTGGTVFIETNTEDRYLTVKISDTGIGIPQGETEKIFEKFYRVKNKETENIQGSGLGLSTSKMIITLHGGAIHVTSEQARGTEVMVKLPFTSVEPVLGGTHTQHQQNS
ncbi:hypothetical protein JW979_15840 [bacterium]|nr:hypothetical protein [candidate division CSSED10-310 bacterium]